MLKPITTAAGFARARHKLGMSQRELGELIGLHTQTVSKYERGAWEIDKRSSWAIVGILCAKTHHGAPERDSGAV